MNVSYWISRHLRLSGDTRRGSSAGVVIAVTGVALALAVMELTLAVVTGFKHEITRKVLGFDAQVAIGAPYDYHTGVQSDYITYTPQFQSIVSETVGEHNVALSIQMPAIIKTDDNYEAVVLRAYDNTHDDGFERSNIVGGQWPDFGDKESESDIVVSRLTADALSLSPGDRVYSCFFVDGAMKTRRVTVAAVYDSGMSEYDKTIAYVSMPLLQSVAGIDSLCAARVVIEGLSADEIAPMSQRLQQAVNDAVRDGRLESVYPVTDALQTGALYFNWLSLLDTNVVVIFILMLCVAAFTLVSSLFMVVIDRIPTIGLLRSLGASRRFVRNVFVWMGLKIVLMGMLVGNLVGIILPVVQSATHFIGLDPDMYYLHYVPVEISAFAYALLNVGVFVAAWLVILIPASSAMKVDPSETLRYD